MVPGVVVDSTNNASLYKDCLKSTLNRCGIIPSELEALAMD